MRQKIKDLFIIAMEESAEIAQACSKAIRFGLNSYDPKNTNKTIHKDEILTEYYQLQAIIEELQFNDALPYYSYHHINKIKKNKINKINRYTNKEKKYKTNEL